jgi:signal transduction histidine kinase
MSPRLPRLAHALFALLLCLAAVDAAAQSLVVRSALAAPGGGGAFPADAPARAVTLPDEWARSRPGFAGSLWYRVGMPSPAAGGAAMPALYIEHLCSNHEVYLNGQLVASGGRMVEPVAHNCNRPQLVPLPPALFRAEGNTLDIRLVGHRLGEVGSRFRAGAISALEIGPLAELAPRHAWRTALAVSAAQAAGASLLLLGGFMFVLGFIHRHQSHLAYFGVLAVGTAFVDLRLWLANLPLEHPQVEFLLLAALAFTTWAGVQFLLRYAGVRLLLADRGLPAQTAVIALAVIVAGPGHLHALALFWYAVMALEVAAAGALHLRRRRGTGSGRLMLVLLGAVAVAGAVELAAQWSGVRSTAVLLAQWVMPVVLVLVGLRLVQQHGHALHQAEAGRQQLEQRVREASAEIERNFRQIADLKVEQVTERERKRIAADLHDDLGAKLLTIVHTSDNERISTLAREALEEMRLSVRGLTGRAVQLADALGDWRAEVVARLGQAGIEGEWHAPEELSHPLSSRAYVQTTRILREATSNIIKHSGATQCSVRCAIADGDFQLVIQDNGNGIAPDVEGRLDRGHGLASMKNRAKQLHGQCLVESSPGYGTVIRLTLPLDRAALPS